MFAHLMLWVYISGLVSFGFRQLMFYLYEDNDEHNVLSFLFYVIFWPIAMQFTYLVDGARILRDKGKDYDDEGDGAS